MQIAKLVAMLIPILTVAVWTYFFVNTELSLTRFILVAVLIPLILASFYIAIKLWRLGKPHI
jgi:hypothetical protein